MNCLELEGRRFISLKEIIDKTFEINPEFNYFIHLVSYDYVNFFYGNYSDFFKTNSFLIEIEIKSYSFEEDFFYFYPKFKCLPEKFEYFLEKIKYFYGDDYITFGEKINKRSPKHILFKSCYVELTKKVIYNLK